MKENKFEKAPSVSLSPPSGFLKEMEGTLGAAETVKLWEAICASPTVSLRLNKKKMPDLTGLKERFSSFSPHEVDWCTSGVYLAERPDFKRDPLWHAGVYYVQEAASMFYESLMKEILEENSNLTDKRPLRVLDLCAAPGGKSTAMLNALESDYVLVANEFDRKRCRILKENLDKWGDPNVIVTNSDVKSFRRLKNYFDIIAIDAPCSGEGMMRREPIAVSQWSPVLVEKCSLLQKDILGDALPSLRSGGVLIYSTCTFNRRENEEICHFIEEEYDLKPVMEPRRFMPHLCDCEGLFVAAFRKEESLSGGPRPISQRKSHKKTRKISFPEELNFLSRSDLSVRKWGDRFFLIPPAVAEVADILDDFSIPIAGGGVEAGKEKGTTIVPSSRQVLSTLFRRDSLPLIEIDTDAASAYLKGNPLVLPADVPKGFAAVEFEKQPLGLVKNVGNRANNLFPPEWRTL